MAALRSSRHNRTFLRRNRWTCWDSRVLIATCGFDHARLFFISSGVRSLKCYDEVTPTTSPTNMTSYSTQRLSQRSQLFPEDRYNGSRSPTPRAMQGYNTSSNRFNSQVMDSLESQNDEMIEGLSQKVQILKNVCVYRGSR